VSWEDHVTNIGLYGTLPRVSVRLRERRLLLAGYCWRSGQSAEQHVHDLLFWTVPNGVQRQGNYTTDAKVLLKGYGGHQITKKIWQLQ
jgi:hypothetical protein